MAIFISDLMTNGALPIQHTHAGGTGKVTANVVIPSGTRLLANDLIRLARIPDNLMVTNIRVFAPDMDAGTQLAMELGYDRPVTDPTKAYNATNNDYISGAVSAASAAYYAAAATAPYQAGGVIWYTLGQSGLDNEFANNVVDGVDGVIDIAFNVSTSAQTATTAAGTLKVEIEYRAYDQTQGTFAGREAFNINDTDYYT